jgi:tetraacyldisaccharide 4'-kinase
MNLIEGLYYIGYAIKKRHDMKNQKRLPYKVISIGNITFGGTGKTPATIAIAEEAKRRGFVPVVLTRGYKGKTKGPCFVSKGNSPLLSEEEAGDEPMLMAEKLKGVPIIKGEDRYEAGMFALENLKSEISNLKSEILFILDDGFQHWRLFRDKDILLIDGLSPFGNKRLLPVGSLREPLNAIRRSDIIVITKMDKLRGEGKGEGVRNRESEINRLIKEIRQYKAKAPIFFAEHRHLQFITVHGETFTLEWARGKRFYGFSGIAHPESFRQTILSAGIDLRGFKSYRDHYRFTLKDIDKIIQGSKKDPADWIVTTEKDIMRLKELSVPANLVALVIEFNVDKEFYDEVFTK